MMAVALPRKVSLEKAWKANVLPEVVWLLRKDGVGDEDEDVVVLVLVDVVELVEVDDGVLLRNVSQFLILFPSCPFLVFSLFFIPRCCRSSI